MVGGASITKTSTFCVNLLICRRVMCVTGHCIYGLSARPPRRGYKGYKPLQALLMSVIDDTAVDASVQLILCLCMCVL